MSLIDKLAATTNEMQHDTITQTVIELSIKIKDLEERIYQLENPKLVGVGE